MKFTDKGLMILDKKDLPRGVSFHKGKGHYQVRFELSEIGVYLEKETFSDPKDPKKPKPPKRPERRINPDPEKHNTKRALIAFIGDEVLRLKAEEKAKYTGHYETPLLLREVVDMYLNSPATEISDPTKSVYTGQAKRIKEKLGNIRVDKLTRDTMQGFIYSLPLGSQENNKFILVNVLNYAMDLGMITYNKANSLNFKTKKTGNATFKTKKTDTLEEGKDYYRRDEVGQILAALPHYSSKKIGEYAVAQLRLFVEMGLSTGMRTGEILGLTWSAVDMLNNKINIHQQLIYDPKAKEKHYISPETKNKKPRTINIPHEVKPMLMPYKKRQQEEQERKGWTDDGMVFTDYRTGGLIRKAGPADWYESFCNQNNLRCLSPHKFRHYVASILYAETKDVAFVAKIIGDEIATVQKYYVHAEYNAPKIACDIMSKARSEAIETVKNIEVWGSNGGH